MASTNRECSRMALPSRSSAANPEELKARHREIIRLELLGLGVSEIAEEMEVSVSQVKYVLGSPLAQQFRQELQQMRDEKVADITARLAEMCPKALDIMQDTLSGEYEDATLPLRLRVAESVLDRAGYSKIVNTRNFNIGTSLSADDIAKLRDRAKAAAAERGTLQCQSV